MIIFLIFISIIILYWCEFKLATLIILNLLFFIELLILIWCILIIIVLIFLVFVKITFFNLRHWNCLKLCQYNKILKKLVCYCNKLYFNVVNLNFLTNHIYCKVMDSSLKITKVADQFTDFILSYLEFNFNSNQFIGFT